MKKQLLVLAVLSSLSITANATCGHCQEPPKPTGSVNVNTNSSVNSDIDVKSKSEANSESSSESSSSTGGNEIGGDVIELSNSEESHHQSLPSHVVPVPPTIVPGAGVVHAVGSCGTLQRVEKEKVIGTFSGIIWDSKIQLGEREYLAPYLDSKGNRQLFSEFTSKGRTYIIGHQPTIISTVLTTGGARQFGLGGNSGSGAGGSGSAGASGATQQMVEHIQLTECIFEIIDNNLTKPQLELDKTPSITKKISQ